MVVRRLREHGRGLLSRWRALTPVERALVVAVLVLHGWGLGWGLPASEGWDVDGVAPRDFLPGLVKTFTPGDHFTYPPLHLLLLTVLTLPMTLVQLVRAPSLAPADLVAAFVDVRVMTAFAVVARLVSLGMSVGIVVVMGEVATRLFGPRARAWTMAIAGVEAACTYYGHTSNLDVPALFWGSLAVLELVRALEEDAPRRLRRVVVLAAVAIATKDQAYAIFALSLPVTVLAWLRTRARSGGNVRELAREAALAAVLLPLLVIVLDGALFNPTGFVARLRFLTGPASQDFAQYARDFSGRVAALRDALAFMPLHHPWVVGALFLVGVPWAVARATGTRRLAALVPLLGIVSFTLAFNCVARRVEERFMLPQMQLVTVYAGGAVATAVALAGDRLGRAASWLVGAAGAVVVTLGLRLSLGVLVNMAEDPRYDAEAWMAEHTKPGDRIETYGGNVYLPRFPAGRIVERIGPTPPGARSPMPGVTERQDLYANAEARNPRAVVFSQCFVWRYRQPGRVEGEGRILPETQRASLGDADATRHFNALFDNLSSYRLAYMAQYKASPLFPRRLMHASLGCEVWVFARPGT